MIVIGSQVQINTKEVLNNFKKRKATCWGKKDLLDLADKIFTVYKQHLIDGKYYIDTGDNRWTCFSENELILVK